MTQCNVYRSRSTSIDGSIQIVKERKSKRSRTRADSSRNPTPFALLACLSQMSGDGGADRDRTGDPLLAKQVLSQLSYSPVHRLFTDEGRRLARSAAKKTCRGTVRDSKVVGLGRVELPTSPLSGVRSNQLSYKPIDRALSSKVEGSASSAPCPVPLKQLVLGARSER